jgi:5-methylcytosine-specific restriction endonuclease McrA
MNESENNLTRPVAFKGRRLASHGLLLGGSSIWLEIIRRVDGGEGFKPVVKSMGIKHTSARKYALILYPEWYRAIAAIQHKIGGKTRQRKRGMRLMHVPEIAFVRWFVRVCEKIVRYRQGKANQLRAWRKSKGAKVFRTPEEKEALRTKNNAISLANYKHKYHTDKAFREKQKERAKQHKKMHPELNRKHSRKAQKKWRMLNPEQARMKDRIHGHARRDKARKQRLDGDSVIRKSVEKCKHVLVSLQPLCYWCGCKLTKNGWHVDHVIPLGKGGAHAAFNLVKACKTCNESKSDKMPKDFVMKGQMVML